MGVIFSSNIITASRRVKFTFVKNYTKIVNISDLESAMFSKEHNVIFLHMLIAL
jgi:hypothetical protein